MSRKFGVSLRPSGEDSIDETVSIVKIADSLGLDSAWLLDSELICSDVYVNLAACALNTSKIMLSPGVTNVITRHAAVTANAIATVDKISGGRAVLGIGAGDSAVQGLGLKPASIKHTEDYITLVKKLFTGQYVDYGSKKIKIMSATGRKIPIHLSVSQRRMCELAGKIANGAIIIGSTNPALLKRQIEWIRKGMKDASRESDPFEMTYYVGFSVSKDSKKAKEEVRAFATSRARWFASWDVSLLPAELTKLKKQLDEIRPKYDFLEHMAVDAKHHGAVEDLLSEEMIDEFAVGGDTEYCIRKFRDIFEAGADRVVPLVLSHDRASVVRTFASEIAPALSK
jgi:5,10-methylenetetrahydromethanopterin reductase